MAIPQFVKIQDKQLNLSNIFMSGAHSSALADLIIAQTRLLDIREASFDDRTSALDEKEGEEK